MSLEGRTAIVTGSSRGIGRVIALELARQGADVVLCARGDSANAGQGQTVEETAAEVETLGRRALGLRLDISQDADLRRLIDETIARFGRIDILVNNAAAMGGGAPFIGGDVALLDHFYRTNVRTPYVLSQLVAPIMAANGGGTIVNISSGASRNPAPPAEQRPVEIDPRVARPTGIGPVYGISKAALDRFATGVAAELAAQNIAIVTVNPGFTITERTLAYIPEGADTSRMEPPETTARAVAFVCEDPMSHAGKIYAARTLCEEHNLLAV